MSAERRFTSLMETGLPPMLRRQSRSQKRGQTRPTDIGSGMRCLMISSAFLKSPLRPARTYSSTVAWAGQASVQGASQSPVCSETSRESAVRRMSFTSSDEASISCPGAGQAEQEGRNLPVLQSFTTQTKQLVVLEIFWL